jgi:hypothetical protein
MTKIHKTARGKIVDMDKIKLSNEQVTAVGNMKVNARGDQLGAGGQVIAGRNQVMDRVYAVESSGSSSSKGYSPNDPQVAIQQQNLVEANKAKALHDLATNLVNNSSIEPTAPTEAPTAPARGSLASSVAKTTTVVQEPMPNPSKSNGPTRI